MRTPLLKLIYCFLIFNFFFLKMNVNFLYIFLNYLEIIDCSEYLKEYELYFRIII